MNTCKRLKDAEREYLLYKRLTWLGAKHFTGLSVYVIKVLLSIHKTFVGPLDFSTESITTPKVDTRPFFIRYKEGLGYVSLFIKTHARKVAKLIFGDYKVDHFINKQNDAQPLLGNLLNDPTVDSNYRTDGRVHPLRITLSGCANGPAISSQILDAYELCKEENLELKKSIEVLCHYLTYTIDMQAFLTKMKFTSPEKETCVSYITAIHDKSCKSRVIAIFDSYSQIVLRPFHKYLQDILNTFYGDYTNDHSCGVHNLI